MKSFLDTQSSVSVETLDDSGSMDTQGDVQMRMLDFTDSPLSMSPQTYTSDAGTLLLGLDIYSNTTLASGYAWWDTELSNAADRLRNTSRAIYAFEDMFSGGGGSAIEDISLPTDNNPLPIIPIVMRMPSTEPTHSGPSSSPTSLPILYARRRHRAPGPGSPPKKRTTHKKAVLAASPDRVSSRVSKSKPPAAAGVNVSPQLGAGVRKMMVLPLGNTRPRGCGLGGRVDTNL